VEGTGTTRHGPGTLDAWRGGFGQSYIQRNQPTAEAVGNAAAVFERILRVCDLLGRVSSVLEVGANVGINLLGLRRVLGPSARLAAVEPNAAAREALRVNSALALDALIEADAGHIPLADGAYDLVFTNGVLIHVPPDALPQAMREICRVTRYHVLCSEYFSHTPQEVPYRGQAGLLWKRDFGRAYLETCPELKPVQYGFLWQVEFQNFDDLNWWMFEKAS
jgi:pseudaminic acid biosynthesis-associated methylase